jgi:glutathione S-transferase
MERVDAIGNGDLHPLEPSAALAIARTAMPASGMVAPGEPNALAAGDAVTVTPDDYGFDPVAGAIVAASEHEIAIRRSTPDLGELVIHFPRIGFRVLRD